MDIELSNLYKEQGKRAVNQRLLMSIAPTVGNCQTLPHISRPHLVRCAIRDTSITMIPSICT
jgi:hypothetical protein